MSNTEENNIANADRNNGTDGNELLEFLRRMAEEHGDEDDGNDDGEETEFEESEDMTAAEFHNKAVDHARRGNYNRAVQTCKNGLRLFPNDIDLLADTVKYSCEGGDLKTAAEFVDRLNALPRARWNWRAYTFSCDYLLQDPIRNEETCRALIRDYQTFIPHEEKAYLGESELEEALGNHGRSMAVLVETLAKLPNAPQCSLHLADMQMDRGLFDEVIKTCDYAMSASCEVQPSINIPYLLLLRTLASDALLHRRFAAGEHVGTEEIETLLEEYKVLSSDFREMDRHSRVIHVREKCLKMLELRA